MPTVRKLTGRNAIDLGFKRIVTPPAQPTPMETASEPQEISAHKTVIIPVDGKKRIHKIDAVPAAQTQQQKLRVCSYSRTSTAEEIQRSSIESQQRHFEQMIAAHDEWEFAGSYVEEGVTGTKAEVRPELQRMLKDCRDGKVDKVLTKSISRFARNTTDCLEMVRELSGLGVTIYFERENIDTGTMGSDFILTLLSADASAESASISGNIKLGIHHRFQSGTYNQPCVPFGYARTPDGVVIVPAEAEVVKEIFSLALTGLGTANIARVLNDRGIPTAEGKQWVASTVQTILHNPYYAGDVLLQKYYNDDQYKSHKNKGERDQFFVPDHHEPIISHEEFENAEALIAQRAKESSASNRAAEGHYPFQSKLFCAECGSPLHRVKTKTSITHVCDAFARNVGGCERGTRVLEDDVKNAFLTVLNKLAFSQKLGPGNRIIDLYINSIRERERIKNREHLTEIDAELETIRGQMETIGASIRFKPGDRAKLNGLKARAEALKREKMALETKPSDTAKAERLRSFVHSFGSDGETGFPDTAFTEFIKRAVVKGGEYIEFEFSCGITLRQSIEQPAVQDAIPTAVAS